MPSNPTALKEFVAFDLRRNIINILGEDHYPFAEYLYHELCANAYDADATEVHITERVLEPAARGRLALLNVEIFDNGNGMDYQHLVEYFAVGESSKPSLKISERLKGLHIGPMGICKA